MTCVSFDATWKKDVSEHRVLTESEGAFLLVEHVSVLPFGCGNVLAVLYYDRLMFCNVVDSLVGCVPV